MGYKAEVKGDKLVLNAGYSHPINLDIPKDLTVTVEKTLINISGISKKLVGDFAALVRIQRKTNPYSMKGIKYSDERVIKKSGKKAG
ncbi:MAG: 50S ribosomal protein L6 [Candidatus Paceibacterota bacterium]